MNLYPTYTDEKLGFRSIIDATADLTVTTYGYQVVEQLKPSSNLSDVTDQLQLTDEMSTLLITDGELPVEVIYEINSALSSVHIDGFSLDGSDLYKIALTIKNLRRIRSYLTKRTDLIPNLSNKAKPIIDEREFSDFILKVITDEGDVKDSASSELRTIRKQISTKKNQVRSSLQQFSKQAAKSGMAVDEGLTIRNGRLVVPVKAEYKRQIEGLIHDESSTGQTIYFEPSAAIHLNNEIRTFEAAEKREINRLLIEYTKMLRPLKGSIQTSLQILGELDAIQAKALLGKKLRALISYRTDNNNNLHLLNARHPVLLLKTIKDPARSEAEIIPFDLTLDENERCLVITGPNAGGKSVTLKTIGLLVMMQQSGFPITAKSESNLPCYSSLFVDLGDDQSIEQDLSTFSSRLAVLKTMIEHANENSLILIDEAGTGTDPDEGSALYQSVIEALIEKKATIIVTTHHGKIKAFVHEHPHAVNASMAFNQKLLQPTYRFQKGAPGSSYAFEIATTMNLPKEIIERARSFIGEKSVLLEELILQLENEKQITENIKIELLKTEKELKAAVKQYNEKYEQIINSSDKIKQEKLSEAERFVNEANAKIEMVIQAIVEKNATKESIKSAHDLVNELKRDINKRQSGQINKQRIGKIEIPTKSGQHVTLIDSGQFGEVASIKGKKATVIINGLKITTKTDNLQVTDRPQKTTKKTPTFSSDTNFDRSSLRAESNKLDIRGKRVDEAVALIIPFIDKALVSNFSELEIIHGKGSCALRAAIHEYLHRDRRIKHFEDAHWDQGGPGCTVVFLK